MKKNSRLNRFVFTSPWLPLIFISLFALSIYAEYANLPLPGFIHSPRSLIFVNNICFLLVIALRFISQLSRLSREFRYDASERPRKPAGISTAPRETIHAKFASAGFCFDKSGYGEKRNLSLPATTIIYGGILFALLVGSYDNMLQFSSVLAQGVGAPLPLNVPESYSSISSGPLASLKDMPRLQVKRLFFADAQWPKGAVEIALHDQGTSNAVVAEGTVAKDGKPLVYRGLDYHLGRFLFEVPLQISTDNKHLEFDSTLVMKPLVPPLGNYTYYASFEGVRLLWDLLYDPAGKAFRLVGGENGKNVVDVVIVFGRDTAKQMGSFIARVPRIVQRAEIHVVRHRHLILVYFGLGIAVIGILLRLIFHPQRVWLEEIPEGCRVWGGGGEAKRLLKAKA
jgi:hypothetical protein